MAGIRISELVKADSAIETDFLPIARGTNTFKVTVNDIVGSINSSPNTLRGNPNAASNKSIDIALAQNSIIARGGANIVNMAAAQNTVLCRLGSGDLSFGSLTTDAITNNSITNAKLAQMPGYTIKLNNSNSTANAIDFTVSDNSILVRNGSFTSLAAGNNTILRRLAGSSTLEFGKVTTDLIDDNAITSSKLASGSVTNNVITDNTINGLKISTNTLNLDRVQQISGQSVLGNLGAAAGNVSSIKISPELLSTGGPSWDTTGRLTIATPTDNTHATTKQYVDNAVANISSKIVDITSGTYTVVAADNNNIFAVKTPSTTAAETVITLPSGLARGTVVSIVRMNSSSVRLAAGAGATAVNADNTFILFGLYSLATATVIDSNTWLVAGDLR